MTTVTMNSQRLLGSLTTARIENTPVLMISRTPSEYSKIEQQASAEVLEAPLNKPAAWDPHEVWFSRVKTPREQRSL